MTVAAVVLAGGRSSRFGRDKLAERIDGRTILELAIDAVGLIAGDVEVLVVVAPDAALELPDGVRMVHDRSAYEGPLAGVAAGLEATEAEIVIVVGGDMPSMVPVVLQRMVDGIISTGAQAVVLGSGDTWRPLPLAVRRGAALVVALERLAADDRRLRSLPTALRTHVLAPDAWLIDDPTAQTLRDVDVAADLP